MKDLRNELQDQYQFNASVAQINHQVRKWGITRAKIPIKTLLKVQQRIAQRATDDNRPRPTRVKYQGEEIHADELERKIYRAGLSYREGVIKEKQRHDDRTGNISGLWHTGPIVPASAYQVLDRNEAFDPSQYPFSPGTPIGVEYQTPSSYVGADTPRVFLEEGLEMDPEDREDTDLEDVDDPKDYPLIPETVNSMGLVFSSQGKYDEAMRQYERELAGREKTLGKDHPETLRTVHNITSDFYNQSRYNEAMH
ncbi:hypothetical protein ABW20_dc0102365 [Dactylellina cionopaga]|nr:hypothetical protein ABW20_dc0102365 [Dactylellina cionopaga]